MESTFGRRHWRCFEGSNTEKTVWGAARTQGVVGSGARTRFGGVLQTCVSAPCREKRGTRFCSETTRLYLILSISLLHMNASLLVCYLRVCVAKVRDAGALTTLGVHTTIGRASDILQGSRISHMYGGLSRNIWARLFYFGPLLRKQVARPNKFKLSGHR